MSASLADITHITVWTLDYIHKSTHEKHLYWLFNISEGITFFIFLSVKTTLASMLVMGPVFLAQVMNISGISFTAFSSVLDKYLCVAYFLQSLSLVSHLV